MLFRSVSQSRYPSYGLIPFSVPSATMSSNIGAPIPSIAPKYSAYNTFGYYRTVEYVFDSLVNFLVNDGGRPISISLVSGPLCLCVSVFNGYLTSHISHLTSHISNLNSISHISYLTSQTLQKRNPC